MPSSRAPFLWDEYAVLLCLNTCSLHRDRGYKVVVLGSSAIDNTTRLVVYLVAKPNVLMVNRRASFLSQHACPTPFHGPQLALRANTIATGHSTSTVFGVTCPPAARPAPSRNAFQNRTSSGPSGCSKSLGCRSLNVCKALQV